MRYAMLCGWAILYAYKQPYRPYRTLQRPSAMRPGDAVGFVANPTSETRTLQELTSGPRSGLVLGMRRSPRKSSVSTARETPDQIFVVKELRRLQVRSGGQVRFFAVPNGGSRQRGERARLAAQGVVPGVPDLILVGRPVPDGELPLGDEELAMLRSAVAQAAPDMLVRRLLATLDARSCCALEMKRESGGRVASEQSDWLAWLQARGWATIVGRGAIDALQSLQAHGYPVAAPTGWDDVAEASGSPVKARSRSRPRAVTPMVPPGAPAGE